MNKLAFIVVSFFLGLAGTAQAQEASFAAARGDDVVTVGSAGSLGFEVGGVWDAAPLASALIGELSSLPVDVTSDVAERALFRVLVDLGLVEGQLSLGVLRDALELVMAGDWPDAIDEALTAVAARAASATALEDIIGVSQGVVFEGQLGPPPPSGPILVGSDYQ